MVLPSLQSDRYHNSPTEEVYFVSVAKRQDIYVDQWGPVSGGVGCDHAEVPWNNR